MESASVKKHAVLSWLARTARCASLLIAAPLSAQTVTGTITSGVHGEPVAFGVVQLLDGGSASVAKSLSNDQGRFSISVTQPGAYRLQVLRIGSRPTLTPPIHLAAGQTVSYSLVLEEIPVSLEAVRVTGRNNCREVTESGTAPQLALEQARAAIAATQLAALLDGRRAGIVTYARALHAETNRVMSQSSELKIGPTHQPWRAVAFDTLSRFGYVLPQPDGSSVYVAPDLETLLSEGFRDQHCFRLVRSERESWIGLRFEPTPERRRLPEITGTLWLDRTTSELRRLEFQYVNVPSAPQDARARGEINFARARDATWLISAWEIATPVFERRFVPQTLLGSMRSELVLSHTHVTGGVVTALARGRDTLWTLPPMTIRGSVVDSTSGKPIAGATVALHGTAISATSDARGEFRLTNVIPGQYVLRARTTDLDAIAVHHEVSVVVEPILARVTVRVPSRAAVLSGRCPRDDRSTSPVGIVTGRVIGEGVPAANVEVVVQWTRWRLTAVAAQGETMVASGTTDSSGTYVVCGVPRITPLVVQARHYGSSPLTGRIPDDAEFLRLDIELARRADSTGAGAAPRR